MLRWLDRGLARGVMEFDAGSVRIQLLGAELAEAREEKPPPADALDPVDLGFDARRDAESELSSAILLGTDAQVNLLLRLARQARHRAGTEGGADASAHRGVRQRLDRPRPEVRPWPVGAPGPDPRQHAGSTAGPAARRRSRRGAARPAAAVQVLRCTASAIPAIRSTATWRRRLSRTARSGTGPPADRMLDQLLRSPSPDVSAVALQQALIDWGAIRPAEADLLITRLPERIEILPKVATMAVARLEAEEPSEHMLEILASLDRRHAVPRSSALADVLAADRDVRAFLEATRTNEFVVDQRYFHDMVERLGRAAPEVLELRRGSVLRACLECRHPYLGSEVLTVLDARKLRPSPGRRLLDLWQEDSPGRARSMHWSGGSAASGARTFPPRDASRSAGPSARSGSR